MARDGARAALEDRLRDAGHSLSRQDCAVCDVGAEDGAGCCFVFASPRVQRFILAHWDAYSPMLYDGNPAAQRNQIERLKAELRTLPKGHVCTCRKQDCPYYYAGKACMACTSIHEGRVKGLDVPVEIGRRAPIVAPSPSADLLDLLLGRA